MERALLTVSYDYDALGRRVAKEIFRPQGEKRVFAYSYLYLSDQDRILIGKSPDGGQTLYLDGEGIDQHLGEVSARRALGYATDHLGSVLNSPIAGPDHAYGPYGEALGDTDRAARLDSEPVIYGFTGRQFDPESRLYYYRARMYDPDIGRFLSRDPMGLRGGVNLYGYARNNPMVNIDPSGNCDLLVNWGAVAKGVGLGIPGFGVITIVLGIFENGGNIGGTALNPNEDWELIQLGAQQSSNQMLTIGIDPSNLPPVFTLPTLDPNAGQSQFQTPAGSTGGSGEDSAIIDGNDNVVWAPAGSGYSVGTTFDNGMSGSETTTDSSSE